MERYIGLDVHAKSCTMVVLSQSGRLLRERIVETNGAALVEAIRVEPGHKHICLEEGTQSAWLYEILSPHVHEVVVLQERRSRGPKSDSKDARELAEKLRTGAVDCRVFKAPKQFARLRILARVHQMVVRDFVRTKSRVKSMYRARGIQTSSRSVCGHTEREAWQAKLPASSRTAMTRLYEQLDFFVELREQAENDLVTELQKHRIARVLQTCPGMGPIRVARLLPVVVTPHRFRTKQQFWSYCGLAVVTRSSADWVQAPDGSWMRAKVAQTRGLNRRRNGVLKDVFKGAATTVITKLHDDPLYVDYQRLLDTGTKPPLAKVTVARKIAATVLRMWKNEEEYDPDKYRNKPIARRSS